MTDLHRRGRRRDIDNAQPAVPVGDHGLRAADGHARRVAECVQGADFDRRRRVGQVDHAQTALPRDRIGVLARDGDVLNVGDIGERNRSKADWLQGRGDGSDGNPAAGRRKQQVPGQGQPACSAGHRPCALLDWAIGIGDVIGNHPNADVEGIQRVGVGDNGPRVEHRGNTRLRHRGGRVKETAGAEFEELSAQRGLFRFLDVTLVRRDHTGVPVGLVEPPARRDIGAASRIETLSRQVVVLGGRGVAHPSALDRRRQQHARRERIHLARPGRKGGPLVSKRVPGPQGNVKRPFHTLGQGKAPGPEDLPGRRHQRGIPGDGRIVGEVLDMPQPDIDTLRPAGRRPGNRKDLIVAQRVVIDQDLVQQSRKRRGRAGSEAAEQVLVAGVGQIAHADARAFLDPVDKQPQGALAGRHRRDVIPGIRHNRRGARDHLRAAVRGIRLEGACGVDSELKLHAGASPPGDEVGALGGLRLHPQRQREVAHRDWLIHGQGAGGAELNRLAQQAGRLPAGARANRIAAMGGAIGIAGRARGLFKVQVQHGIRRVRHIRDRAGDHRQLITKPGQAAGAWAGVGEVGQRTRAIDGDPVAGPKRDIAHIIGGPQGDGVRAMRREGERIVGHPPAGGQGCSHSTARAGARFVNQGHCHRADAAGRIRGRAGQKHGIADRAARGGLEAGRQRHDRPGAINREGYGRCAGEPDRVGRASIHRLHARARYDRGNETTRRAALGASGGGGAGNRRAIAVGARDDGGITRPDVGALPERAIFAVFDGTHTRAGIGSQSAQDRILGQFDPRDIQVDLDRWAFGIDREARPHAEVEPGRLVVIDLLDGPSAQVRPIDAQLVKLASERKIETRWVEKPANLDRRIRHDRHDGSRIDRRRTGGQ